MDYFPLGLAKSEAFCNRIEEQAWLKQRIQQSRHVLLSAPRRYGKSSLVQRILDQSKMPYEKMDLSLVASPAATTDYFLSMAERLLLKLQPSHKKAFEIAKRMLKNLTPKLIFDEDGAKIELAYQQKTGSLQQLSSVLSSLDKVAKESKKKAVIYVDEFQQIALLDNNHTIEAAIRSAAQEFEMLTFIFTGSNRKLLLQMFDDKNRPFFQLCEKVTLDRIAYEEYEKHLQMLANMRWKTKLSSELIKTILSLTERHPYYVNFLCSKIWRREKAPTLAIVSEEWQNCLLEEWHLLTMSVITLAQAQKMVLQLLASQKINQPMSKQVAAQLNITPRTISKSVSYLMDNDYIYKDNTGHYCLINPLLKLYIETQLREN